MNVIPIRRNLNYSNPPRVHMGSKVVSRFVSILWFLVAFFWPVLRWLLAIDVTFQFFRMLIGFSRSGLYFDWSFFLHFLLYTCMICFVTSKR
ncbi:hypothetical protein SAMN05216404_11352 [Nitrosospira multiformis]|uniref:Protein kleE n=1 Tax=Nitrosospira multiformis TaxID=1231 RepID=A0A1H8MNR3_9PROT|nr:hypothetical protein SAMN05216404_11352 [Nitrosospira multiformis]